MVQTRLSRWYNQINGRPYGERCYGKVIQITKSRQHLYVLCDGGVLVCVDVPWLFRDELCSVCKDDVVCFVVGDGGDRLFHSVL